jgi:ankyrin repeat protein
MTGPDTLEAVPLFKLVRAIVAGDITTAKKLLAASPALASARFARGATREASMAYYLDEICYIYAGDTALHIAAAVYQKDMVANLTDAGADVRARNRLGVEPLHAAAMGLPGSTRWNPRAQAATIACLIEAGADPNALDKRGVAPLHRAVRTRCALAVRALLEGGADPRLRNKSGSTPMLLAIQNTGRGGSGSREAKAQQKSIVQLLQEYAERSN